MEEFTVDLQRLDGVGQVSGVGEGIVVEDWRGQGVCGIGRDSSATQGLEDCDGDGGAAAEGGFLHGDVLIGVEVYQNVRLSFVTRKKP